MNVNSLQQFVNAVQKNPQVMGEAVSNGVGVGFEDMLQQASQKQPANNTADKPANTDKNTATADNKPQAADNKPQTTVNQNKPAQTNEPTQDVQENQQALAAALAYNMPVQNVQVVAVETEAAPVVVQTVPVVNVETAVAVDVNNSADGEQMSAVLPQLETAEPQNIAMPTATTTAATTANLPEQQAAPQAVVQNTEQQPVAVQAEQVAPQTEQTVKVDNNALAGQQQEQANENGEANDEAAAAVQTPVFGNHEAVPVKVMDAEPLDPQTDDAADQLAQKINQALNQGESRVTLNLTPANLGNLTVEITRLSDGTLTVLLSAVTEKAAGLLDKHSGSLQTLLAGMMPGGNVRVDVENRMADTDQQQLLNPDQQENQGGQQQRQERQQSREEQAAAQTDFMQQLRLGLVTLEQ